MTPFTHHKRWAMTAQRIAKIFASSGGHCHKCKRKLYAGDDYDIDHVVALENGGTDEDSNLAPCCSWCHTDKTADDHAQAGKSRRQFTKHNVPKRYRQGKGWRT